MVTPSRQRSLGPIRIVWAKKRSVLSTAGLHVPKLRLCPAHESLALGHNLEVFAMRTSSASVEGLQIDRLPRLVENVFFFSDTRRLSHQCDQSTCHSMHINLPWYGHSKPLKLISIQQTSKVFNLYTPQIF